MLLLFLVSLGVISCSKSKQEEPRPDHPQLTPGVKMVDVTFHSAALGRDMQYRAVLPAQIHPIKSFLCCICCTVTEAAFAIGQTTLMLLAMPSTVSFW